MPRTILVIEDDPAIRQGLLDALAFNGYATLSAGRGDDGLKLALTADAELILLDLILPGKMGLDLLAELRQARPTLPVIILTAKGDEADRIRGLKLGADDYVVKPFSIKELLARVEAVLRRSPERPTDVKTIEIAGGTVDLERREVRMTDGRRNDLSEKELELLGYLARNKGRAISRDEMLFRVWGIDPRGADTRTIDMHIVRLREKLHDDPSEPHIIRTVRGKGYMFA
jgi:DNA-binding response OmpR family regulator